MALNTRTLGPAILNLEKNNNALLVDVTLKEFAVVNNSATKQKMIAFTIEEHPEYYFWASTSLFQFLEENVENAVLNPESRCLYFPDDVVKITHKGTVPLKSDPTKNCNVWYIETYEK
jgi:hypothetical protein